MGKKNIIKTPTSSVNCKKISKNGINKKLSNTKNETKNILNVSENALSDKNKDSIIDNIMEKVKEAVKSHKEYASNTTKNSLFPDVDNALSLTFTLKKLAPNHQNSTKYIDLPFPERSPENTSVCLILPDIAKTKEVNTNTDTEIESREWAEILEEKFGIDKSIYSKIYTLRQLRREVRGFEAIQSFSRSYDVFMSASNIFKSTISHLGKNFLKINKALYPLCLKSHPKQRIENAVRKTAVRICPSKLNMLTKIGNTSQKIEELVKNAEIVLKTFLDNVPGGLENIRCIYLSNVGGVISLPVYLSTGNPNDVKIPKPKVSINTEDEVIDEVNTIVSNNVIVGVTKSGKINLRDAATKELLGKKKRKFSTEEKDIIPTKTAKKDEKVLEAQTDNIKNSKLTNEKETKCDNNNTLKVSSGKEKISMVKKLQKDDANVGVSTKTSNKVLSVNNVGHQNTSNVLEKNKKSKAGMQQTQKLKNTVEKKSQPSNVTNTKTTNGKRELTPPTLRSSVKQKKKANISKVEENKAKVDAPLKAVSEAPKVFVAEGSSGKASTVKKVKSVVKKKSNGSIKKNK